MQAGLCYLHDGGSSRHSDSLALGRDTCTGARSRQNGGYTRQQHARERERVSERDRERKSQEVPNVARKRKSGISKWSVCLLTQTPEMSKYVNQFSSPKMCFQNPHDYLYTVSTPDSVDERPVSIFDAI